MDHVRYNRLICGYLTISGISHFTHDIWKWPGVKLWARDGVLWQRWPSMVTAPLELVWEMAPWTLLYGYCMAPLQRVVYASRVVEYLYVKAFSGLQISIAFPEAFITILVMIAHWKHSQSCALNPYNTQDERGICDTAGWSASGCREMVD